MKPMEIDGWREEWEFSHYDGPYRHFKRVWVEVNPCTAKVGPLGFRPSPSWPRELTQEEHAECVRAYDEGRTVGMTQAGVLWYSEVGSMVPPPGI